MTLSFTFADLFAGIGGFHAALSSMGGECVFALEKDEEAAKVYEHNWGIDPRGDATSVAWNQVLPDGARVDVLCGGFPCQPFSKGGAQRGMAEARGTLFYNICEAIEAWQPQVVMLENVRNLAGPRHKHEWDVVISSLRDLGYRVSSTPLVISPSWLAPEMGGRPHNRERIFILGTRVGKDKAWLDAGMEPTVQLNTWPGPWDLEHDLPLAGYAAGPGIPTTEFTWGLAWEDFVNQARAAEVELPSFPLWADVWSSSLKPGTGPGWKERIISRNLEFAAANPWVLSWMKAWKVDSFPASRRKFEWQAQDATSLQDCLVTMRPSGLRVKKATYTGALVAIDQRPIVWSKKRRLSVRECARLQGLPEWFDFSVVSDKAAYKQLGNGVNVGVVYYVLRKHLLDPETRMDMRPSIVTFAATVAPESPDKRLELMPKATAS